MKKKLLIFILALVMTLVFIPSIASAASTKEFAGGSGTAKSPYLISTKAQLNNVRNHLDAHFKLTCDIVFTKSDFAKGGAFYNKGAGWEPIGTMYSPFAGTFDGNGFAVKNLYVNISSEFDVIYVGLFVYNCGTIQNLGMVAGNISVTAEGFFNVGGIAGINCGTITNCYNTGKVSATTEDDSAIVGGIAGTNYGTITDCYNTGNISATATDHGSAYAGGIAGENGNMWADGTIANCYNTGKVSATSEDFFAAAGGIAGWNDDNISNCYNTGKVSATSEDSSAFAGGIAGFNDDDIENSYYLNTVSKGAGNGASTGTTSCTAQQMQTKSTFAGFDFKKIWEINTANEYKYPVLRSVNPSATLSKTSYTYDGKVKTPAVTVKNGLGKSLKKNVDYTVTYSSGRIKLGTYKVTIKGKGNYSFTKTLTFKINPIKASNCAMKLSATSYTYDGKMKAPTVKITSPTGSTLTKGRDYTVSYASGRRNAGTYKVTVTFKGNYSGTKTQSFKINPIKASNCAMKLSAYTYTYDGKMKAPTVKITSPTGSTLTKGTSYTVTYASGRKNVGTYKVTVTMKGNYTGTRTLTFKIVPKAPSVKTLTAKTKALTVQLNKQTTQTSGYEIQYATSKTFTSAKTATITSTATTTKTLSGLRAKTTYFVRVRAYKTVNGTKFYSNWSAAKYLKTK